jgi:hypothetical protein
VRLCSVCRPITSSTLISIGSLGTDHGFLEHKRKKHEINRVLSKLFVRKGRRDLQPQPD